MSDVVMKIVNCTSDGVRPLVGCGGQLWKVGGE